MMMRPIVWAFPLLLAAGAAAGADPAAAPGASPGAASAPKAVDPAAAARAITTGAVHETAPAKAAGPKVPMLEQPMSMEARVVLQQVPEGGTNPASPGLRDQYPDKDALLTAIKAAGPGVAVDLDGKPVRNGFGPSLKYRTTADGTVRR